MKLFAVFIITLVACVSHTEAAVAIQLHVEKPPEFANQTGCYIPSLNKVLPYDEPYYPKDGKNCVKYLCSSGKGETRIFSCGVIAVDPPYKIVPGNLELPYPDCCEKAVRCDNASE